MLGVLSRMAGAVEIVVGLLSVAHPVGIVGKGVQKCASEEDMAEWRRFLFPIGANHGSRRQSRSSVGTAINEEDYLETIKGSIYPRFYSTEVFANGFLAPSQQS